MQIELTGLDMLNQWHQHFRMLCYNEDAWNEISRHAEETFLKSAAASCFQTEQPIARNA